MDQAGGGRCEEIRGGEQRRLRRRSNRTPLHQHGEEKGKRRTEQQGQEKQGGTPTKLVLSAAAAVAVAEGD